LLLSLRWPRLGMVLGSTNTLQTLPTVEPAPYIRKLVAREPDVIPIKILATKTCNCGLCQQFSKQNTRVSIYYRGQWSLARRISPVYAEWVVHEWDARGFEVR
jgi:hypothetical protein